MALVSLGDLAQSFLLRRQTTVLKSDMQRLSTELTTGQVVDLAARVSGDLGPISGIDASLARLQGYATVTTEAGLFASTMQTALAVVDDTAQELAVSLTSASSETGTARVDDVAHVARQGLETALTALNTRVGDRAVFAGTRSDGSAVTDAETLLQALEVATAGAATADDVATAVSAWFRAPEGYASAGYLGGPPLAGLAVAAGEEVQMDMTAADPALRDTLEGLALAALMDRGVLAGQPAARKALAGQAGALLLQSQTGRTRTAEHLGMAEAQIDAAASRNAAEADALALARNDLTAVDPYDTATRLQEAESQIALVYAVTARMSRLSLLDYL